jgi:hypothetical protein
MALSLLQTSTVQKTHLEYKSELRDKLHNNKPRRNYAQAKSCWREERHTERQTETERGKKNGHKPAGSERLLLLLLLFLRTETVNATSEQVTASPTRRSI